MTDNEIIKALECCSEEDKCQECPYGTACLDDKYISIISKDALDLIRRLQAENAELKSDLIMKTNDYENVKSLYENAIKIGQKMHDKLVTAYKQLKTAKSEARKEFAERVKPIIKEIIDIMFDDNKGKCMIKNCYKHSSIPCESKICIDENKAFWNERIDNLLKEMEEENV